MGLCIINIRDQITPDIMAKSRRLADTRPLVAAMGKALEKEMVAIFREFNETDANQKGWPRRNFWKRQVADKTMLTAVEADRATVTVSSPEYIHKLTGGDITPKSGKTLAIPANGQAYRMGGPRASGRDYTFLLLAQGNLVGALLNPMAQRVRITKKGVKAGKETGGEVMYWLVRKVTTKPEPWHDVTQDPHKTRIAQAVYRAFSATVNRIFFATYGSNNSEAGLPGT
jgi:hypothetical protein